MLSMDEKQYLIWLAAEKFEGWGAIVELGVWLGSSSAALAEGLRRRGSTARIHSFDLFRWENYMTAKAGPVLNEGDDFLPLYLKETASYSPWIEAKKVDLMNFSWNGGPIEILFVDSAKTWDLTNATLNGFGRYLVPGRSRIVLQDFHFHWAHCLPLIFDSRPDVWKQVEDVEYSTTVTFMPLKLLYGPSGIQTDYSEESFPLESADHLLRSRMAQEEPANRYRILQTLYRKYLIDGPMEEALKLREEVLAGGIDESGRRVLEDVGGVLTSRGWKAYNQGQYEAARAVAERILSIPGQKSIHSLALLGFSLLQLGDPEGARRAAEEALTMQHGFLHGRLLRVEVALAEGRHGAAEAEALDVLKCGPHDERTIQWILCLLTRAWSCEGTAGSHAATLGELAGSLSHSPSFLSHLAAAQYDAGQRQEAMENVDRALALAPGYALAAAYRAA